MENITKDTEDESNKPLVMLVDDEVENINVLRQLLESHFQIITGLNGAEALKMIDNMVDPKQIQLILSDQRMPKVTGIEFFEQIVDRMPDTIRIILTGYSDTQVIIDSINKAKLYKFMTKPFDPVELSLTVQRGVEAYQMRQELLNYTVKLEKEVKKRTEELTKALENLERLSLTDQLTGLNNRHFLSKMMPNEIAKLERDKERGNDSDLTLVLLDIDHFKYVNDTYGHDAGDKVLIQISHILKSTCRDSDWVVRWGGEEFLIVARGLTRDAVTALAERIRVNIEEYTFNLDDVKTLSRTCSIGISMLPFIANDNKALTWQQTLNLADIALYAAKNNGRNMWTCLFELDIRSIDDFYHDVTNDISKLIDEKQINYISSSSQRLNFSKA